MSIDKLNEASTAFEKGEFLVADKLFAEIEKTEKLESQQFAHVAFARGKIAEKELRWRDAAKHYDRMARLDTSFETLILAQRLARDTGNYSSALSLGLEAKELAIKNNGKASLQYINSLNNIAGVYSAQGNDTKAEFIYDEIIEICDKHFDKKHSVIAIVYNNLASIYYSRKHYKKAERLFEKSLKIREDTFGKDHEHTANAYHNLAGVYEKLGKFNDAKKYYQQALKIHESVFGKKHPLTAASYSNLATFHHAQGHYNIAKKLSKKSLKIYETVLGKNHPDTAIIYNNLAGVYEKETDYKNAEKFYNKAIKALENSLGAKHPTTKKIKANYENFMNAPSQIAATAQFAHA